MIQFHVYPGGKKRILTFSYDDGSEGDLRLVGLFNRYGMKATFHLNDRPHLLRGETEEEAILHFRNAYAGHEISCHTSSHGWPSRMPTTLVIEETRTNRLTLERLAGYPIVGMSYPSGSYNEEVEEIMRYAGIVYSRTAKSTLGFALPDDFLAWHPSCHHRDADALADKFLASLDSPWTGPLFYIWGHAHEFRTEQDWAKMEALLKKLAFNDKIWYATNIEIHDYMRAQKLLRISADEKIIQNPTATDVWIEKDKSQIVRIPAGETVAL